MRQTPRQQSKMDKKVLSVTEKMLGEGYGYADIAKKFNIKKGTLYARYRTALRRRELREQEGL